MSKINYETPMGLLKRWDFETEPENSFLYALQHYKLTGDTKRRAALSRYMGQVVYNSVVIDEIVFNNHVDAMQAMKTPYTSHDQLTAYVVFNPALNAPLVWEGAVKMKFRYDNLNPAKPKLSRLLHPRDILFFGIMADNLVCKLLSPLLYLMMLYTMIIPKRLKKRKGRWVLEKKNSNEILWWLRCSVMRGLLGKVFRVTYKALLHVRFDNLHGLMLDYYVDPEHPVCVAAKTYNVYNNEQKA